MPLLVLGLALTIGVVLLLRGFLTAEPRVLAQVLRWTAAVVAVILAVLLIVGGREGLLFALAMVGAPLILRRGGWRRRFGPGGGGAGQPAPGRTSRVEPRLLRMTLDHDSGALSGEIIGGRFRGQGLSQLDLPALLDLLSELADRRSAGPYCPQGASAAPPAALALRAFLVPAAPSPVTPAEVPAARRPPPTLAPPALP